MTTKTLTYTLHTWNDPAAGALRAGPVHLAEYLTKRYGGKIIGGYNPRPKRGKSTASQHRNGTVIDWRHDDDAKRALALADLEHWQYEYGIQRIHDYAASRAWYCGDTARGQKTLGWHPATGPHFGEAWAKYLHIEQNIAAALDTRTMEQRREPAADLAGLLQIARLLDRLDTDPVTLGEIRPRAVAFLVWAFSVLDTGDTMPNPNDRYNEVHQRRVEWFQRLWRAQLSDAVPGAFDGPTARHLWARVVRRLELGGSQANNG